MAVEHKLIPSAKALSESLRDIGYSLETAIADIVDNSISAGADQVAIHYVTDGPEPYLAITDNGHGMSGKAIIDALRHGSAVGPEPPHPGNLGKFGLGLKTASFSQCRRLTVVSSKDGVKSAAEWDLNLVNRRDDWVIRVLEEEDICRISQIQTIPSPGTLVLWRNLDRMHGGPTRGKHSAAINQQLIDTQRHLGLVFHRFLKGAARWHTALSITMNGHPIDAYDPFFTDHTFTQRLPDQTVYVGAHPVELKTYILPHYSNLGPDGHALYASHADLASNQGVYVYRNDRLIAWGGWFRLIPKGESTKLARVSIDYTSALDKYWTIDVKKSHVKPPSAVRTALDKILVPITECTVRLIQGRGQRVVTSEQESLWERFSGRNGPLYSIRTDHPLVTQLNGTLSDSAKAGLTLLLKAIVDELPVDMIFVDGTDLRKKPHTETISPEDRTHRLRLVLQTLPEHKQNCKEAFRDVATTTQLFSPSVIEKFISDEMT